MKILTRSFFAALTLAALAILSACGSSGGTPSGVPISISLSASAVNINAGQSTTITATVTGDSTNAGVGWSQSGPTGGSLTGVTTFTVVYNAPANLVGNSTASITAISKASSSVTAAIQIFITGAAAPGVTVKANPTSILVGQVSNITATVTGETNTNVNFVAPALGTITGVTQNSTGATAVYTAPASITGNSQTVTIKAVSAANTALTATTTITVCASAAACAGNTAQLIVDGGPLPNSEPYPNGVFASATICVPGSTTQCATIDHLLVDTGSFGVRILASAMPNVPLTPITGSGATLYNCIEFGDGSFLWGTVALATVQIGGESTATVLPDGMAIQVVADPPGGPTNIPSDCSGTDEDNQAGLLANGIIGIGVEPTDCVYAGANYCDGSQGGVAEGIYYWCTGSVNTTDCPDDVTPVPDGQQVTNPVVAFATDNNGSLITFPAAPAPTATVSGTLTFGIGTESNNGIGAATVYAPQATQNNGWVITTNYNINGANMSLPFSFFDSGSSALFINNPNNTTIAVCSDNTGFFCPPGTGYTGQVATNLGANGTSGTVTFGISNADLLFTDFPTDYGLSGLAGPFATATDCSTGTTDPNCGFDWGFPFFYGRTVYTSIDETVVNGQVQTPWWAY
ncbi:MAG TPA: DUF3443 family protein [Terriglobales bacterium]